MIRWPWKKRRSGLTLVQKIELAEENGHVHIARLLRERLVPAVEEGRARMAEEDAG